jgi:hypothetical protein
MVSFLLNYSPNVIKNTHKLGLALAFHSENSKWRNNQPTKKRLYESNPAQILTYKHDSFFSNNVSGYDMRYNQTNDDEMLLNITRFNYQMKLLNKLNSPNVSQKDKLDAIEQYNIDNRPSKYLPNIKAGGLFKDWE